MNVHRPHKLSLQSACGPGVAVCIPLTQHKLRIHKRLIASNVEPYVEMFSFFEKKTSII